MKKKAITSDKRSVLLSTVFYIWNLHRMNFSSSFDYWIKWPDILCAFLLDIQERSWSKIEYSSNFYSKRRQQTWLPCLFWDISSLKHPAWRSLIKCFQKIRTLSSKMIMVQSVVAENGAYRSYIFLKKNLRYRRCLAGS